MDSDGGPVRATDRGLLIDVRLQPGARHTRVDGLAVVDDGTGGLARVLKVRVSALPAEGRANAALLALLAKTWKLPKSSLSLAAGRQARRKTVLVAEPPAALRQRLTDWLAELPSA
ncbi:DUF167 domain-containing protein [Pelagibius sp.]|uniref:DUF167 domain-containing protein n=1 Tax=Pelagibius sp. TaxID=1931238 RepID=UPI002631493D|nr:DUF167 domain-containing protein [Pelagibius sp.]